MRFCVDRFEGDIAVIVSDNEAIFNVDKKLLPVGISEGDIVISDDMKSFAVDKAETANRMEHINSLFEKIINKKDGI